MSSRSASTERNENFFDAQEETQEDTDDVWSSTAWLGDPANTAVGAKDEQAHVLTVLEGDQETQLGRVGVANHGRVNAGASESLHVNYVAPGPAAAREPRRLRRISSSPVSVRTTDPDFLNHYLRRNRQIPSSSTIHHDPRSPASRTASPRSPPSPSASLLSLPNPPSATGGPTARPSFSSLALYSQSSGSDNADDNDDDDDDDSIPLPKTYPILRAGLSTRERAGNGINPLKQGRLSRPRSSLLHPPARRQHPLSRAPIVAECSAPLQYGRARGSPAAIDRAVMARRRNSGRDGDLFFELADDQSNDVTPSPRAQHHSHRTSYADKRRSLQLDLSAVAFHTRRSSTSSNPFSVVRPSSRLNHSSQASEWSNHTDQPRIPTFSPPEDATSLSGQSFAGQRSRRYSVLPERLSTSPSRLRESMQSPDVTKPGRRGLSFSVSSPQPRRNSLAKAPDPHDDSTAESSDPKHTESTDVESQTAETVWDELDDLKFRIKKLELTGKLPPNSSATVSGESSERPRTATTAPTTVDSSPKRDSGPDFEARTSNTAQTDVPNGTYSLSYVHPMLHSALAKAKPLLNGSLYRILEAASNDALQLVAMTGNSGLKAAPYPSPSPINGTAVSDRQVRRKADTLCRNLTDLCIALTEGKHEPMSAVPSPMLSNSRANSPSSLRHARHSLGPGLVSTTRPGSRLDARRSSILGIESPVGGVSVRNDNIDVPSDQESTPTYGIPPDRRRFSRDSSLLRAQMYRPDDFATAASDADPTLRPHSRAFTDLGGFRTPKSNGLTPQRTPSLRETLEARRAGEAAFDGNIELLGSEPRRRRGAEHATTPPVVLEEDADRADYPEVTSPSSVARRRVTSFGQYQARRSNSDLHTHTQSLSQRRQVFID